MRIFTRHAWIVVAVLGAIVAVFGVSSAFADDASDPFPHAAKVLVATFGAGMGIFTVALAARLRSGSRAAWFALWYLPLFFAIHVATLGTYLPDIPFALVAAGALVTAPRSSPRRVERSWRAS